MKRDLENLSTKVMTLIPKRAQVGDLEGVKSLSEVGILIRNLIQQTERIENEAIRLGGVVAEFEAETASDQAVSLIPSHFFKAPSTNLGPRGRGKKLLIEIDWSKINKTGHEAISENLASSSVEKFLNKLAQRCGVEILDHLRNFRVSRGPLVSKEPSEAFLNKSTGSLYAHQPIGDTGYFVLTNSSTSEKVADLTNAVKFLRLPIGFVYVSEVEKL